MNIKRIVRVLAVVALVCRSVSQLHAQATDPEDAALQSASPSDDVSSLALEDLLNLKVYAASKFVQDVAQAPASVTIVGSDEIGRHGYRTLADILRSVRGFYVAYDRDYSYVGVRGFLRPGDYNGRVLLLVNGHRMNDTIYEQALLGTESPLDVSLFDRVEVIRGPSSSLYGTSAFFAVVNIVTRTGRSVNGVEAEADGGSQALRSGRLTAGGKTARGFEGLFSVSAYGSDGNDRILYPEFAVPGVSDGYAIDADRDRSGSLFASGSAGDFTAQVAFGSRTKTIPTAAFGTLFNDPRTKTTDTRGFADLRYSHRFDPRTTLELRGAYDDYVYKGAYAYDTGVMQDDARNRWATGEASISRQVRAHALTAGFEYRHNFEQDQWALDETGVLLDDHRRSDTTGAYVEDEFRVHPRVILNAGLRWDEYFGLFGGTVNPRLGLMVTPFNGGTVKLLYGHAYRAPNPFELYYDQNAITAQLKPERIRTFEAAWEQRLSTRLQATASVFRNRVLDLISQRSGSDDTIDGLYYRNGDNTTATGAEVELQGELPGRVRLRIAQAFQNATLDSTDRVISNSPRVLSTIVADAPIPHTDAIFAFDGHFIGERRRVNSGMVPGAFVGNVSVSRRVTPRGLGVGLTIYNVFDADYADPGSVEHTQQLLPQDGRTAAVRVSWHF